MSAFDYVILAMTAISILISIWRGLVREVMSLLSWLGAIWAAIRFSVEVAQWLPASISNPSLRYVVAFVLIFLCIVIVLELFGVLLAKLFHAAGLAFIDRLLGAVFGFARGALLAWILTLLGGLTALPGQPWWREALLAPPLQAAVLAARPLLPLEVAKRLKYS